MQWFWERERVSERNNLRHEIKKAISEFHPSCMHEETLLEPTILATCVLSLYAAPRFYEPEFVILPAFFPCTRDFFGAYWASTMSVPSPASHTYPRGLPFLRRY
jgi:hypothetical protein